MSFKNSALVFVFERRAIIVSVASSIFCCTSARRKNRGRLDYRGMHAGLPSASDAP